MSIIIPTAVTTYGDSSPSEGSPLRKYVLAQFRSDAHLEWVGELRSFLVKEELKYKDFRLARPRIKAKRELWSRIENGVGQASVIIIDPDPIEAAVREYVEKEKIGADILVTQERIADTCATALIAGTPIAYLPLELAKAVPWGIYDPIARLEDFMPQSILRAIGGGLRQAQIFAARAHATFDLAGYDSTVASTNELFRSPLSRVMLAEILSTRRVFDDESPKTVAVLNRMSEEIADSLVDGFVSPDSIANEPLVREVSSRAIDELQAADIAAGWAREIIDVGDITSVANRFERLWVNGKRVK